MKKSNSWQLNFVFVLIVLFAVAIISRLFFLQILEHKHFQAQALGQQVGFSNITGARGQIFSIVSQDTRGKEGIGDTKSLAVNKDSWAILISVENIKDKQVFAQKLSEVVRLTELEITEILNKEKSYAIIKENLTSEELSKVKNLGLEGLNWQNNLRRIYPQGEFLGQAIGFLGGEGSGQYGLEGYYDDILKGKDGIKEERSGLEIIFSSEKEISLNGSDLYLTIDYNIQFQAESLLKKAKENLDIEAGQIIVLKPSSGRVLAVADFPCFNPNYYYEQSNLEIFQSGAVQKLFEPGSIMKPFTMASAINEGKISPESVYTDTGSVTLSTKTIRNFNNKIYGEQTMTQVLENSINTGAVYAQQQIGNKTFFKYVEKFGFTQKTGIDIQGEVYSRNENLKNGPDINFATAAFGQGVEATPMQIVRAFSAIANGGFLPKPYVVEKIVNGADKLQTLPENSNSVISAETAAKITSMLVSVMENGFDKLGKIPGYYLAGKTGTAQVPLKNKKGYDENKTIQSFMGFGPAYNPEFLILIKLDNPKVSASSLSALPVFKELAQYIINYWKIPPDYDITE